MAGGASGGWESHAYRKGRERNVNRDRTGRARGRNAGYLIGWEAPEGAYLKLVSLLPHAAKLLMLQLTKLESLLHLKENHKDKFMKKWILGELTGKESILLGAAEVGLQLKVSYRVGTGHASRMMSDPEQARLRAALTQKDILFLGMGKELVFLLPPQLYAKEKRIARFQEEVQGILTHHRLIFGFSPVHPPETAAAGLLEAREAVEIGPRVFPDKTLFFFEDMRYHRLIKLIAEHDKLKTALLHFLEPLLAYDQKNQSQLLDTLIHYFRCNGSIKETSQVLFCHYNSVVYRMERIQQVLDANLNDSEQRLQAQLAVLVYDHFRRLSMMP
ncbi:helix-turn-helix domain-containing protein [Paenibacillus sp. CC-CFT747]|nr:helix-turn-helix domain-containing protein [Paenibacillus sp. CC-CFT747]